MGSVAMPGIEMYRMWDLFYYHPYIPSNVDVMRALEEQQLLMQMMCMCVGWAALDCSTGLEFTGSSGLTFDTAESPEHGCVVGQQNSGVCETSMAVL